MNLIVVVNVPDDYKLPKLLANEFILLSLQADLSHIECFANRVRLFEQEIVEFLRKIDLSFV
jgi:hypothetical protein